VNLRSNGLGNELTVQRVVHAGLKTKLAPSLRKHFRALQCLRVLGRQKDRACFGASIQSTWTQGKTAMPNTVRLHRVLSTKPEKVYRAFIEADAVAKWLPPNGFVCTVHQLDAKVGGIHRMSFRNFTTGKSHSFGGEYVELVPNERLRYTDKFDDPSLTGQMQVTVTLRKVSVGTELNIVQEGVPDVIPLEACYLGWQESLRNLARLVEPEINQ
jgi:uncharacterized protein YndB with AHSA1/START domain